MTAVATRELENSESSKQTAHPFHTESSGNIFRVNPQGKADDRKACNIVLGQRIISFTVRHLGGTCA